MGVMSARSWSSHWPAVASVANPLHVTRYPATKSVVEPAAGPTVDLDARAYVFTIGVADGSIIPAIITAHMLHMRATSPVVQADVIGIESGDIMSPVRASSSTR